MSPEELLKELTLRGIELEGIESELDEERAKAILKASTYYMKVDFNALLGKEIHDKAKAAEMQELLRRRHPLKVLYVNHRDYWVKTVEFLQHHWALIERQETGVIVHFLRDRGGKFDQIHFSSKQEAERALQFNGFAIYDATGEHDFIDPPSEPLMQSGRIEPGIYSSGQFWNQLI